MAIKRNQLNYIHIKLFFFVEVTLKARYCDHLNIAHGSLGYT